MNEAVKAVEVKIMTLPHFAGLPLPAYQSEQAAGMDLAAAVPEQGLLLPAGQRALVPTGLMLELPRGFEAQLRPRSGLALKQGITLLNSPGTIDADYRGEVGVILINHSEADFRIERGMRIAQMVIAPVIQARLVIAPQLAESERGSGGFGHSGI